MAEPKFNLTVEEAISTMEAELTKYRAAPRGELKELDPDTAFDEGYAVALSDLRSLIGPDPRKTLTHNTEGA